MDNIKENAKPYFFDTGSKTLAILVHGFTSSPHDFLELAQFLASKGISVKAPLLAGHGRTWQDLEHCTCYDWWNTVNEEIKWAEDKFENIILVGYSFGSNLSLDMAVRYPDKIKGVVVLGISVFLHKDFLIKKVALPLVHFFSGKYRKRHIKADHIEEYENNGCYSIVPTAALKEFYKFIKYYTQMELFQVKVPTLIIHSRDDDVTHPLSSQYVYDRLGSHQKELLFLDELNHNPLESKRKNFIFTRILDFINALQ